MIRKLFIFVLLSLPALAATYTVKTSGGNYSTVQACATAMQDDDTCLVFAGTYNENVNVPAASAGHYKYIQINNCDAVYETSVTLNSHVKLIGCNTPNPAAGSGLNIGSSVTATGSKCVTISSSAIDVWVPKSSAYQSTDVVDGTTGALLVSPTLTNVTRLSSVASGASNSGSAQ